MDVITYVVSWNKATVATIRPHLVTRTNTDVLRCGVHHISNTCYFLTNTHGLSMGILILYVNETQSESLTCDSLSYHLADLVARKLTNCGNRQDEHISWWRHEMETFSALLALCAGNSPVTGEFPSQRPVTRSFNAFFDLCLNKRLVIWDAIALIMTSP